MKNYYAKQIVTSLMIVILSSILFVSIDFAQTVKMKTYPQITTIEIVAGSGPAPKQIAITTETDDPALNFKWTLNGPGTLKGASDAPGIIYLPPEEFSNFAKQAIVTVEVANKQGKKASSSVTLTLTAKELPPPPKVQIRAIQVKENDILVSPMFEVNPGATLTIEVDISGPPDREITLEGSAILGKLTVSSQTGRVSYTAAHEPGEADPVTLKILDAKTKEVIEQRLLVIKVNETAQ